MAKQSFQRRRRAFAAARAADSPPPRGPEHRLLFTLPPSLAFAIAPGRVHPVLWHCRHLIVDEGGHVEIAGYSKEAVFAQAARWLTEIGKAHPAVAIAAVLVTVPYDGRPSGRDSWSITLNATVSFAPTALGAEVHHA
jgi:hypothetical protein